MAKKKLGPLLPSSEIWQDAFVLLQYAHRLEKNHKNIDFHEQRMLFEVHEAMNHLRLAIQEESDQTIQTVMVDRMIDIYKKYKKGKLTEKDYEPEILKEMLPLIDQLFLVKPTREKILKKLKRSKEELRAIRGPGEAAAQFVGELFERGATNLKNLRLGKRIFKFRESEPKGFYHWTHNFCKAVMEKTLGFAPELIEKIIALLNERNLAEKRTKQLETIKKLRTEGLSFQQIEKQIGDPMGTVTQAIQESTQK